MYFSKQQMETALMYQSAYFNKVLFVNFNKNTFIPIKINKKEWDSLPKIISFTDWVKDFINSPFYKPCEDGNSDSIEDLLDLNYCARKQNVLICNYYKLIDGDYHVVQLELYPDTEGFAYLFVRDLTTMQNGLQV